jgi:hypothetical protein
MVLLAERYELLRRVGMRMGRCGGPRHAARRRVAVKTVLLEDSTDAELSAASSREASATRHSPPRTSSPSTTPAWTRKPPAPTAFIVMELLEE